MSYTVTIFDHLCNHLAQRAEHTARVAFGHACEQWISSEAFAALNWPPSPIPAGTHVLCECRKRDITLFEGGERNRTALATIEVKMVYPNADLDNQLLGLRKQLRAAPMADETTATERGAFVYAIWYEWFTRRDTRVESEFHRKVETTFRGLFGDSPHHLEPASGLRPIIAGHPVSWLNKTYQVSLYALCAVQTDRLSSLLGGKTGTQSNAAKLSCIPIAGAEL